MEAIRVSHLKKNYRKKAVLSDINLRADTGEWVVIAGRNGCGKSTLLQILAGALPPSGGELRYLGEDPLKKPKLFRQLCGYVPQQDPLMEELTVLDNLRLWGYRKRRPDPALLEQFGLSELLKQRVDTLSGGMKRRVSFACAAIVHPQLLLLDEPTGALDICYRDELHRWMGQYVERGGTILMTSHDQQEIMEAGRCMVMNQGKLYELSDADRSMRRILELTKEELEYGTEI
jgi:ABC-2 type transport system ATP-binding protein